MLGYVGGGQATSNSYFGQVSTDFGMDDVLCQGSESDILDCPHITTHNCGPSEGAGVICNTCKSSNISVKVLLSPKIFAAKRIKTL